MSGVWAWVGAWNEGGVTGGDGWGRKFVESGEGLEGGSGGAHAATCSFFGVFNRHAEDNAARSREGPWAASEGAVSRGRPNKRAPNSEARVSVMGAQAFSFSDFGGGALITLDNDDKKDITLTTRIERSCAYELTKRSKVEMENWPMRQ